MASVEDDESSYEEVEVTDDEEDEESEGKVAYYMVINCALVGPIERG